MARQRLAPLTVYGFPPSGGGLVVGTLGRTWYVNGTTGSDGGKGYDQARSFATIQRAVDRAAAGDLILVAPGAYDESVTVARAKSNLTIVGMGGRGAAFIEPSTENATGMDVRADDVTLVNLGVAGEDSDSTFALRVYGARFRAYGCKFEGAAAQVIVGPGTVAQDTAGTHGDGADALFEDCEFAWGVRGIDLTSSDYGACTQPRIRRCLFHNLTTCHIRSNDVGASNVSVRDVRVEDCTFANDDANTAPTDYLLLNVTGDTGYVQNCTFMTTVHAASVITLATGVKYVKNWTEQEPNQGGTSGRPD